MYLSITNEISIRHVLMERDLVRQEPISHFKLSYQFVPSEYKQSNMLRLVQDTVNTGFIGGHLLNIPVPENHHIRLFGKSAKVKKNSNFIKKYSNLFFNQVFDSD